MDTELTAYLEKVREDVEGIYVGYPEIVDKHVPKLMQIIDTLLSVAGSHVRQPRDSAAATQAPTATQPSEPVGDDPKDLGILRQAIAREFDQLDAPSQAQFLHQWGTVIRCDCSECTAGRRIAELIKDAKGGA